MYQIYAAGQLIHDANLDDDGYRIPSADLELELGKTGSFEFTIYPNHTGYDAVQPMAEVTVARNYVTIYTGRVLTIKYGFYNEKIVTCEGELSYLLDVLIEPHTYTGSFTGYLSYIIGLYNEKADSTKQFVVGAATVAEFMPFTATVTEYTTAFDILQNKMVSPSGGYLQIRNSGGNRYVDLLSYYADGTASTQTIELGKNLLDLSREFDGTGVFSAIIPLGAKIGDTDQRIDITGVNNGVPYIVNDTAKAFCNGLIFRQVIFDNITNAQTLKTEAGYYLAENYSGQTAIEVTAADLSGIDKTLESFRVGQWVNVYSYTHFAENPQLFVIQKLSIDLLSPARNKIVIGRVKRGLSETVAELSGNSPDESGAVQPYVMESGTTGIWSWKIFSDNTCEFFGKIPVLTADVTTALGGWYRGANLYESTAYEYPVEMTEAPAVSMTFQTRNGLSALLWINSPDADTAQRYLPQSFLIRPTTATGINGNINIIAKGKVTT